MSDFYEPIRGEICDPEEVREFCLERLKPIADHMYGGDFSDSVLGDRVASVMIRNGLKIYFDASCALGTVMEEDEAVVYPIQNIALYIGVLVVEEDVRQRLIDTHSIASLDDALEAILSRSDIKEGEDVSPDFECDAPDEIDFENARAWLYLRLLFDYVDGSLCEADRYYALDTYDDHEIIREPLLLDAEGTDEDTDDENVITSDEFDRLKFASQLISQ
jgi:hypothetical protein